MCRSSCAIRGTLGALTQLMVTFGILSIALLGLLFESNQKTTFECGNPDNFDWSDVYDGDITSCSGECEWHLPHCAKFRP